MPNLFNSLSTYHPKPPATPFEVYCLRGLAHVVEAGSEAVAELLGLEGDRSGSVQSLVDGDLYADAVFGGRTLVETAVESPTPPERLDRLATAKDFAGNRVYVGLGETAPSGWTSVTWSSVADALAATDNPLERQFAEFIRRDVLGAGPASLHDATGSNRFYAMGGAAVRARFSAGAVYENSASQPITGEFRYLGTTFAPGGGDTKNCWIGIVNETVPLGQGYRLMMASRDVPMSLQYNNAPRATTDWNWDHWTDMGPVEGEVTRDDLAEMLSRLEWPGS